MLHKVSTETLKQWLRGKFADIGIFQDQRSLSYRTRNICKSYRKNSQKISTAETNS